MWIRRVALSIVFAAALSINVPASSADTLRFADGSEVEGVIKKVESGKVVVVIGEDEMIFDILDIDAMDFNTPHLLPGAPNVPLDHFMKNIEAQELVRNVEELKKAEEEIRRMLVAIRGYWLRKQPVTAAELAGWEAAKEEFRKPLARYQELLNDLYFHVLAEVDEYNVLANEASKVYVGVKGIRTGSALVPREMRSLPLKRFVPATWYDTIFYEGYNLGFTDSQTRPESSKNHE
jgi:hypothetical protein